MNTSNYTGRTHRTLTSAFGPYTSSTLHAKAEPMHKHDIIVLAGSIVAGLAVFVLVLLS